MHLFVSDYDFDAGDLSLMPIIIPQFDLQAEFPDLDFEYSSCLFVVYEVFYFALQFIFQ
jgi:hypothetical protein